MGIGLGSEVSGLVRLSITCAPPALPSPTQPLWYPGWRLPNRGCTEPSGAQNRGSERAFDVVPRSELGARWAVPREAVRPGFGFVPTDWITDWMGHPGLGVGIERGLAVGIWIGFGLDLAWLG